jgi:protocatechuate 3,4-dioxygenase beta subunit
MTDSIVAGRSQRPLSRRGALRALGVALAAVPVVKLLGCSSSAGEATTGASTGGAGGAGGAASTASAGGAGGASTTASAGGADGGVAWATGGTASMTAKASYPNPFASGAPSTCALTCEMTQGPCYSSQSVEIQDISYGYDGLPTRMYFQVVDESCNPVAGAVIDVWHVSPVGKYSGDDAANEDVAFCTGNDSDFTSHLYFRGKQTTDAAGLAYFDSCFPGWYSSRTVHVHLTISIGGAAYVTTQLFFEDALDDEIIDTQPVYDTRGHRDTTNETDTVISASAVGDYLFQTEKMPDGAMLAWKTIVLRSSASETLCQAPGGSGGTGGPDGGMGGPPPDGGMGGPPPDGGP